MIRRATLETIDDHVIFTLLSEPDVPTGRLVIMAHGFRGNSTGPARSFVNFERRLIEAGYSCLRFDQPGSGNSTGDFAESSFNTWVETLAYLTGRYLHSGFRVALLGQSMGATAAMVAAARPELRDQVPCVLLWVPDPKTGFVASNSSEFQEEEGQLYPERFWAEARDAGFFTSVAQYPGGLHLVYGEHDRYVSPEDKRSVIDAVRATGGELLELPGEDHSPWAYASAQRVFDAQLSFLNRHFL